MSGWALAGSLSAGDLGRQFLWNSALLEIVSVFARKSFVGPDEMEVVLVDLDFRVVAPAPWESQRLAGSWGQLRLASWQRVDLVDGQGWLDQLRSEADSIVDGEREGVVEHFLNRTHNAVHGLVESDLYARPHANAEMDPEEELSSSSPSLSRMSIPRALASRARSRAGDFLLPERVALWIIDRVAGAVGLDAALVSEEDNEGSEDSSSDPDLFGQESSSEPELIDELEWRRRRGLDNG